MTKYQLLPIPLKQPFSNNGINEAVPYTLPSQEDNLNWLEGFTDAFQRPVVPSDLGQPSGRYIRMGQLNQVINNLSTAILNVKQGLDNVQGTIDNNLNAKIDRVVTEANKVINNREVTWLMTTTNQSCNGLKNFTDVNIDNFKTATNSVSTLEFVNMASIQTANYYMASIQTFISFTITQKGGFIFLTNNRREKTKTNQLSILYNNMEFIEGDNYYYSPALYGLFPVRNKDVIVYANKSIGGVGGCYGCPEYKRSTFLGS